MLHYFSLSYLYFTLTPPLPRRLLHVCCVKAFSCASAGTRFPTATRVRSSPGGGGSRTDGGGPAPQHHPNPPATLSIIYPGMPIAIPGNPQPSVFHWAVCLTESKTGATKRGVGWGVLGGFSEGWASSPSTPCMLFAQPVQRQMRFHAHTPPPTPQ